jgi:DNA-binding protein H-NS
MGLSDRLKDLQVKAQDAVVEHSEQIHDAVAKATTVADERTGGKYREHLQKVGAKAEDIVGSLKASEPAAGAGGAEAQPSPQRPSPEDASGPQHAPSE